jgi:CBS domain-containing protein
MRVSDVMTRDVACCSPDDPLTAPAQIMWEHDCGAVPVIQPESRRTLGMITDRDICMAAFLQNRPLLVAAGASSGRLRAVIRRL